MPLMLSAVRSGAVAWELGDEDNRGPYGRVVLSHKYYEAVTIPDTVRSVLLVGSLRHGHAEKSGHKGSLAYHAAVVRHFRKRGFAVESRMDQGDPDSDFVFMAQARMFLKSAR